MCLITILNQSLIKRRAAPNHIFDVDTSAVCILCLEVIIIIVERKSIQAEDGAAGLLINVVHTLAPAFSKEPFIISDSTSRPL